MIEKEVEEKIALVLMMNIEREEIREKDQGIEKGGLALDLMRGPEIERKKC